VVGFPPDLRAVEALFTSLLVQATRTMASHGARCTSSGRSRTRSFRQAFLTSFAARIGERLAEATHDAEAEATDRAAADRASLSARQTLPDPEPYGARSRQCCTAPPVTGSAGCRLPVRARSG
jgi:hypothetical protein